MLQAMNTGHDGSISTIHSNSPRDSLSRLETITMMAGMELSPRSIREQIASAIQLIVHQQRLKDGSRRFTHVTEIAGMEGDVITLQDLFLFDFSAGMDDEGKFRGRLKSTGLRPKFLDKLAERGVFVEPEIFALGARGARLMLAAVGFWGTPAALALADRPRRGRGVPAGRGCCSARRPSRAAEDRSASAWRPSATVARKADRRSTSTRRPAGGSPTACHRLRHAVRRRPGVQRAARRRARGRGRRACGRASSSCVTVGRRVRAAWSWASRSCGSPMLALGCRSVRGARPHGRAADRAQAPRGEAARTAPGRADDHGELAPRRPQLPAVARHDGEGDRAAGRDRVPAGRRRDPPGPARRGRAGGARRRGWAAPTSSGPSSP